MQSLGSTSSWLSRDSLSSSHSLPFSESEQTEDEADVFLSEGEGDAVEGVELGRPSAVSLRSRSARGVVGDQAGSQRRSGQTGRCPSNPGTVLLPRPEGVRTATEGRTEGDCVFAQKCAELQVFVRPLLELLNGVKKGRYTRGLSSFQQSVAMDRIQRIVGVLQKPSMGEKYLQTLLQVEMLLRLWFPQISPCAPRATAPPHPPPLNATHRTPPRWHRDQLHIPVKKRRLSWTDTDCLSPPPDCKHLQQEQQEEVHVGLEEGAASPRLESSEGTELDGGPTGSYDRGAFWEKESEETQEMVLGYKVMHWPKQRLSRLCGDPLLHSQKSCPCSFTRSGKKRNYSPLATPPPSTKGSPATQDTLISSTTTLSDPLNLAPPRRQSMRCQSEPVAKEREGRCCWAGVTEASQGWSRSLPHLMTSVKTAEQ